MAQERRDGPRPTVRALPTVDTSLGELDVEDEPHGYDFDGLKQDLEEFRDHPILQAVLAQGCDVGTFAAEVDAKLGAAEAQNIEDYISEAGNLADLHRRIRVCDGVLAKMEAELGAFQTGLGALSTNIRALQDQSSSLTHRVDNRRKAAAALGDALHDLVVPPDLITAIMRGDVDGGAHPAPAGPSGGGPLTFAAALEELDAKLAFVRTARGREAAARQDVEPELERLRTRAVARAREVLLSRFAGLRRPRTNIQILQQSTLLPLKGLVSFLRQHGAEAFPEVRSFYVSTVGRTLSQHFRAYLAGMDKIESVSATHNDLLGSVRSEASGGGVHGGVFSYMEGLFGGRSAAATGGLGAGAYGGGAAHSGQASGGALGPGVRPGAFTLGSRGDVLRHLDAPALIPHVEKARGATHAIENIFRSVQRVLMDTASAELSFCRVMFAGAGEFRELFQEALTTVHRWLETRLAACHDTLAVLIMIRVSFEHGQRMEKRGIDVLDAHFLRCEMVLWPRLKALLDEHVTSLYDAPDAQLHTAEPQPHFVTRRYAELTASLLLLSAAYEDQQIELSLDRLKSAYLDLLARIQGRYPSRKDALVFRINNLDLVSVVLAEAGSAAGAGDRHDVDDAGASGGGPRRLGAYGEGLRRWFEEQVDDAAAAFRDGALQEHFRPLVAVGREVAEAGTEAGGAVGLGAARGALEAFGGSWRGGLAEVRKETLRRFPSLVRGNAVLKAVVSELLVVYSRVLEHARSLGPDGEAVANNAVAVPTIMYEIRQLTVAM
ncbi:unnamed protein product [Pedinophyceae sp. YPF-701]|nr:unnamed protein product [Pedinophyceae sp. YPF-701]